MKSAVLALLLTDAPVAALVGDRIAWDLLPDDTALPAIVLLQEEGQRFYSMSRASGPVRARLVVNMMADTRSQAEDMARAVRVALSGLRRTIGRTTFQGSFLIDDAGQVDPDTLPPREVHHAVRHDYDLWHTETDDPEAEDFGSILDEIGSVEDYGSI